MTARTFLPMRPPVGAPDRILTMGNPEERRCILHEYELMLILPTDLDEEGAANATERVRSYVTSRGGDFHSFDLWGRRRLAYPIDKRSDGTYHVARFSLGPEQAIELDRALRLNEQVLRHIIVNID